MIRKILVLLLLVPSLCFGASFLNIGGLKLDIQSSLQNVTPIQLFNTSSQILRITGSSTTIPQLVKLPNATGLRPGYWYNIINEAASTLTISNSSSEQINVIPAANQASAYNAILYLTSNATSGGPWAFTMNGYMPNVPLVESAGEVTVDWSSGDMFSWTLNANCNVFFKGQSSGQVVIMRVTNTASNYTVGWPIIRWSNTTPPTQSQGAASDVITCLYEGSDFYCNSVQNMR